MKTCICCNEARPDSSCMTFELTADEQITLARFGVQPPQEFVYCKPCWQLFSDPTVAPRLLRATCERQALMLGVHPLRAKASADKLYSRLIEAQRKQRHKTQS